MHVVVVTRPCRCNDCYHVVVISEYHVVVVCSIMSLYPYSCRCYACRCYFEQYLSLKYMSLIFCNFMSLLLFAYRCHQIFHIVVTFLIMSLWNSRACRCYFLHVCEVHVVVGKSLWFICACRYDFRPSMSLKFSKACRCWNEHIVVMQVLEELQHNVVIKKA